MVKVEFCVFRIKCHFPHCFILEAHIGRAGTDPGLKLSLHFTTRKPYKAIGSGFGAVDRAIASEVRILWSAILFSINCIKRRKWRQRGLEWPNFIKKSSFKQDAFDTFGFGRLLWTGKLENLLSLHKCNCCLPQLHSSVAAHVNHPDISQQCGQD